jgi:hypothetical protein
LSMLRGSLNGSYESTLGVSDTLRHRVNVAAELFDHLIE